MSRKRKAPLEPTLYVAKPKGRARDLTLSTDQQGQQRVNVQSTSDILLTAAPVAARVYEPVAYTSDNGETDFWSANGQIPHNPDNIETLGIKIITAKRYQNSVSIGCWCCMLLSHI